MLPIVRNHSFLPSLARNFWGDEFLNTLFDNEKSFSAPSVNIIENPDEFRIEVAAPGLSRNDFRIDLHNQVLTISSESKSENKEKNDKYLRCEFNYSTFSRSFNLPETVDTEKITAVHKDGILQISVPKKEITKEKGSRQISIE